MPAPDSSILGPARLLSLTEYNSPIRAGTPMTLVETFFNVDVMVSAIPALMRGFFNTLLLGLLACGIGIPVGLLISLVRLYAPKPLPLARHRLHRHLSRLAGAGRARS